MVTGGASGIGRAVVVAFIEAGCRVVVLDLDGERAEKAAQETGAVAGVAADVSNEEQVKAAVAEAVGLLGRIDVLVNSAGLLTQSPLVEMSAEQWRRTIDVDLTGVFLMCRHVVPGMVEAGHGRVVNIASQLALKGGVSLAHYAAAKAGVLGLTKSLALEVARAGVLVNAIAPGPIVAPEGTSEREFRAVERATPLGRWGGEAEIAKAVAALVESDFITGETIRVDGGRHLK